MNSEKRSMHWVGPAIVIVAVAALIAVYGRGGQQEPHKAANGHTTVRLAFFPNVTHAPALVGVERGEFQKALGAGTPLDPKAFNAGPEAMEALLAGSIDVAYVGPCPAVNTYLKSGGKALRLIAGVCQGGASLVAAPGSQIASIRDLNGKRLAVPQIGGTQDISARRFLALNGLQPKEKGGTVEIIPVKNPDILSLMKRGQLDAAWVPEPWTSRLLIEAKARLVVDERDLWPNHRFTTTVIVARTDFLRQHPDEVKAIVLANVRSIDWIAKNPAEAQRLVNHQLQQWTGKVLADAVIAQAWNRVGFAPDIDIQNIQAFADSAKQSGYLSGGAANLNGLVDQGPLKAASAQAAQKRK